MTRSTTYPIFPQGLPETLDEGKYVVRFATNADELESIQRLRFEVFNLELGEGLEESHATGLDQDRFDPICHHLMVLDASTGTLAGTYRIQTYEMAEGGGGFYSADEFDLEGIPLDIRRDAIEVGRAAVGRDYRNQKVLFLLWRGLAAYMKKNDKRYLFGCCSLTSQDPADGRQVMDHLEQKGHCHAEVLVRPRADWACYQDDFDPGPPDQPIKLPKLFRTYLRYGAKVCGPPALDRFFKTIDYLVLLDTKHLDRLTRALFFG